MIQWMPRSLQSRSGRGQGAARLSPHGQPAQRPQGRAGAGSKGASDGLRDAAGAPGTTPAADDPAPLEHWGCGWFDSSFELRRGLAVIEQATPTLELAVLALLAPADSPRRR